MREILFRGKKLSDGEWVYGCPVVFDNGNCSIFCKENGVLRRVEPETVSQYTGLQDKNGKKIFEEDIVTIALGAEGQVQVFGTVSYRESAAKYCVWLQKNTEGVGGLDLEYAKRCQIEVVGNIWDNPELLKEDTQ